MKRIAIIAVFAFFLLGNVSCEKSSVSYIDYEAILNAGDRRPKDDNPYTLTPPLSVFHILTPQERYLLGQFITVQHRALRGTHKPGESWMITGRGSWTTWFSIIAIEIF